jgi:hypothetical protein
MSVLHRFIDHVQWGDKSSCLKPGTTSFTITVDAQGVPLTYTLEKRKLWVPANPTNRTSGSEAYTAIDHLVVALPAVDPKSSSDRARAIATDFHTRLQTMSEAGIEPARLVLKAISLIDTQRVREVLDQACASTQDEAKKQAILKGILGGYVLFDVLSFPEWWQSKAVTDWHTANILKKPSTKTSMKPLAKSEALQCSICLQHGPVLERLPPMKYSLSTFNTDSFEAYGRKANHTAPVCADCGPKLAQAVNLIADDKQYSRKFSADQVTAVWASDGTAVWPVFDQVLAWNVDLDVETRQVQCREAVGVIEGSFHYVQLVHNMGRDAVLREQSLDGGVIRERLHSWLEHVDAHLALPSKKVDGDRLTSVRWHLEMALDLKNDADKARLREALFGVFFGFDLPQALLRRIRQGMQNTYNTNLIEGFLRWQHEASEEPMSTTPDTWEEEVLFHYGAILAYVDNNRAGYSRSKNYRSLMSQHRTAFHVAFSDAWSRLILTQHQRFYRAKGIVGAEESITAILDAQDNITSGYFEVLSARQKYALDRGYEFTRRKIIADRLAKAEDSAPLEAPTT